MPDLVVLVQTPGHDSQENRAERSVRTLKEQAKVMKLDVEHRTGEQLVIVAVDRAACWLGRSGGAGKDAETRQEKVMRLDVEQRTGEQIVIVAVDRAARWLG